MTANMESLEAEEDMVAAKVEQEVLEVDVAEEGGVLGKVKMVAEGGRKGKTVWEEALYIFLPKNSHY